MKENIKKLLFQLHDHMNELEETIEDNRNDYDCGAYDTLKMVTLNLWSILQQEDRKK